MQLECHIEFVTAISKVVVQADSAQQAGAGAEAYSWKRGTRFPDGARGTWDAGSCDRAGDSRTKASEGVDDGVERMKSHPSRQAGTWDSPHRTEGACLCLSPTAPATHGEKNNERWDLSAFWPLPNTQISQEQNVYIFLPEENFGQWSSYSWVLYVLPQWGSKNTVIIIVKSGCLSRLWVCSNGSTGLNWLMIFF